MSQMQPPDNPRYSDFGAGGDVPAAPERTSILAIVSLVLSLICFVPGLGLLGLICGIAALFGIGGSQGRVGGKGLAIAGIVLGLLFTVMQVGAVIGMSSFWSIFEKQLAGGVDQSILAIEQGDWDTARKLLTPTAAANVTDEQFEAFRAAYQAELGAYKGLPQGFLDYMSAYTAVGQQMQPYQGRPGLVPLPAKFDNGTALILFEIDQGSQPNTTGGTLMGFGRNLMIAAPSGKEISLVDGG